LNLQVTKRLRLNQIILMDENNEHDYPFTSYILSRIVLVLQFKMRIDIS